MCTKYNKQKAVAIKYIMILGFFQRKHLPVHIREGIPILAVAMVIQSKVSGDRTMLNAKY